MASGGERNGEVPARGGWRDAVAPRPVDLAVLPVRDVERSDRRDPAPVRSTVESPGRRPARVGAPRAVLD
jgi:hypothetical protein